MRNNGFRVAVFAVLWAGLIPALSIAAENGQTPAGFSVLADRVPSGRETWQVPAEWQLSDRDPWQSIGKVNTQMPPVADADRERGYVVFVRHYADPTLATTAPLADELRNEMSMFACPGEYEPVSFCVRALDKSVDSLAVTVGTLKSERDALPAECVDLRMVRDMPAPIGSEDGIKKYIFRPLILEKRESVNIAQYQTARFWLTVKVPDAAVPGDYSAPIEIKAGDAKPVLLTLRLKVLPFRLETPDVSFAFWHIVNTTWTHFYHDQPDMLRKHCIDMAAHGMNSVTFYTLPYIEKVNGQWKADFHRKADPFPCSFAEQIQAYQDAGLTKTLIWYLGDLNLTLKPFSLSTDSAEFDSAYTAVIEELEKQRKEHGWPTIVYSPHDEIDASPQRMAEARHFLGLVRKLRLPTFQSYIGMKNDWKQAADLTDIVCFAGDTFRAEFIDQIKEAGKPLWTYSGNARYGLDPKGDRYYFGLFTTAIGADGTGQWAYQCTAPTVSDSYNPYDPLVTSADYRATIYAYPAPDGLLPTIGYEGVREGIDDGKYIHTLRHWIALARQSDKPNAKSIADDAEARLNEMLAGVDINRENVQWLEDWKRYTSANEQPNHKQPDAMLGSDFDQRRWQWAEDIVLLKSELMRE